MYVCNYHTHTKTVKIFLGSAASRIKLVTFGSYGKALVPIRTPGKTMVPKTHHLKARIFKMPRIFMVGGWQYYVSRLAKLWVK
jgi:hypothetical protein